MPRVHINQKQFVVPKKAYGEDGKNPIRQDQFFAEFSVSVGEAGCYAFDVELIEDDDNLFWFLNPDEVIASDTSATLKCFCMKSDERRTFSVTTAAKPMDGHDALTAKDKDATALPPLRGHWPKDDAGSELELRLEITVYQCNKGPCTAATEGKDCLPISHAGEDSVFFFETKVKDVILLDGTEPHEVIGDLIKQAVGAGAGTVLDKVSKLESGSVLGDGALLALAGQVRKLKKQMRAVHTVLAAADEPEEPVVGVVPIVPEEET